MNGLSASTKIVPITPWWQTAIYGAIGVVAGLTVISMCAWIAYYASSEKRRNK
jgi:hypothetical protein